MSNTGAWKGFSNSTWHWMHFTFSEHFFFFVMPAERCKDKPQTNTFTTCNYTLLSKVEKSTSEPQSALDRTVSSGNSAPVGYSKVCICHKQGKYDCEEVGWLWKIRHSRKKRINRKLWPITANGNTRNFRCETCLNITTNYNIFFVVVLI